MEKVTPSACLAFYVAEASRPHPQKSDAVVPMHHVRTQPGNPQLVNISDVLKFGHRLMCVNEFLTFCLKQEGRYLIPPSVLERFIALIRGNIINVPEESKQNLIRLRNKIKRKHGSVYAYWITE